MGKLFWFHRVTEHKQSLKLQLKTNTCNVHEIGGGIITGWGRRKNETKQQQNKSIKDVKEHLLPATLMQKKKRTKDWLLLLLDKKCDICT